MKTSIRKSSFLAIGLAGLLSASAFVLAVSVPSPAEARIVCHETWRGQRCVETQPYRVPPRYIIGGRLPRHVAYRPVPRDYYYRYRLERVPVGYSYVMVGSDVLLLDRARRVVRVYD